MSYDFTTELIRTIQSRLRALGYYQGDTDGLAGPMTSAAVSMFKQDCGYRPRDLIGTETLMKMFGPDAPTHRYKATYPEDPTWVSEARRLIEVAEVPGKESNPTIIQWAKDLDQWYPGDDVAWCGLFVAHCMSYGAPDVPQDFNRLGARAWLNYGVEVGEVHGAIAVFWRTHKTQSYNGHVGFVVGKTADSYVILGGNQSDKVCTVAVPKSRLLGLRAPPGYKGSAVKLMDNVSASSNEA